MPHPSPVKTNRCAARVGPLYCLLHFRRGRGGTGRRAALRRLWPQGCGGSTPLVRTISISVVPGAPAPRREKNDPLAAYQWAAQLPQSTPLSRIVAAWVEKDAPSAVKLVSGLPEGKERNTAIAHIFWAWTSRAPQEAAQFAAQFPSGEMRQRALQSIASSWARKDPVAAEQWAAQLTEGPERDAAVNRIKASGNKSSAD